MNRRVLVAMAMLAATACGGDAGTGLVTSDQLHFLRLSLSAPPLATPTVSVWAHFDSTTEARVLFHALPGASDSVALAELTIPAGSLRSAPDGSPLGPGDSVRVTLTVIDPVRMIVQFEPSGLRFSPSNPARLAMAVSLADPDLNGDGRVDANDGLLEGKLHIWRQECTGDPWMKVSSTVDVGLGVVRANLAGFTNYAVAY